jgi:LacI family transcriptional regulator
MADELIGQAKPATLKDVAIAAGVSIGTVSKALNGGYVLRPETQERVRRVAEELNFAPNKLAQGLLNGRSGTVGLLTSDLDGRFSIPVLMGAEDAFGSGQVSVLLCDARGDTIREQHHLQTLLSRRVDGLIVVGHRTDPRRSLGRAFPVPIVYAYAPSDDPQDISVISDNVGAGRIAAEHLLDHGRTQIGYIAGDISFQASRDRVAGASAALGEHGLAFVGGEALYGAWSEEWGRGAVRTLLTSHPEMDAVLCGSDHIARGVIDALRESGVNVPEDIAVMGHDNWDIIATQSRPPLSTIDMDLENIGRFAAELLFRAIDGDVRPGQHAVATRLVTRGSTVPSH